jgi:hypothetical protein
MVQIHSGAQKHHWYFWDMPASLRGGHFRFYRRAGALTMSSVPHFHGNAHAALAAWCADGFTVRAVVELRARGGDLMGLYAWGRLEGVDRLVIFHADVACVSDDRGQSLKWSTRRLRGVHHAARPEEDE